MLFGKKCIYCGGEYSSILKRRCPFCDNIDFANIDSVTVADTEMTYRTETEEEFDPVMSDYLSDMDGWQHYETNTVKYRVENGYNITFLIYYTDGSNFRRTYHETHPMAQRLQEIAESNNLHTNVEESLQSTLEILNDITRWDSPFDYDNVAKGFRQLAKLYNLSSNPTEQDLIEATRLKISSILMSDAEEYVESVKELLFYLLAQSSDDNDDFSTSTIRDIIFTQKTKDGTDAFSVLSRNEDVTDSTVLAFVRKREVNKFRKILVATLGNNKSEIQNDNVIIWDMKMLISAYMKAFKKAAKSDV